MKKSYRRRRIIRGIALNMTAVIIGLAFSFPFLWMILSSLKLNKDVLAYPVNFLPPTWNWQSYVNVFTAFPSFNFPRFILNSVFVTVCAILLCLFLSATAGYGFSKYRFRGNALLFTIVLSTVMISFEAIVVPLFIFVRSLGMQNSYWGLIIPEGLSAFGVFMMRQFFYALPNDYLESARMDGANEYLIFARIALPMARTALLALVIFHAQYVWNMLLWPMILISSPDMRVLPQGIALFKGGYNTPYPEQLAACVISCLPLVLLYLFFSKYFIKGVAMTGIKG